MERGGLKRLSELTGKSPTHLHFVLRGERTPALDLAIRLADLGHPVWELYPDLQATVNEPEHAPGVRESDKNSVERDA